MPDVAAGNPLPETMNKNIEIKLQMLGQLNSVYLSIPIQFGPDLPLKFPVKIRSNNSISDSVVPPQKPLVPPLFQIVPHAVKLGFKDTLQFGHAPHTEKMLDAERLEAVLRAFVQKKNKQRALCND
jgi:hypothetical protein